MKKSRSIQNSKQNSKRILKIGRFFKSALCIGLLAVFFLGYLSLGKQKGVAINEGTEAAVKTERSEPLKKQVKPFEATASSAQTAPQGFGVESEEESLEGAEKVALNRWNEVRNIPGASELADEIAEYLQNEGAEDFSFADLEATADETGMVEVGDHSLDSLIKDEKIRAKFQKLMQMVHHQSDVSPSNSPE